MPRASVRGRLILVALLAVLTWSQSMLEAAGQALVSRNDRAAFSISLVPAVPVPIRIGTQLGYLGQWAREAGDRVSYLANSARRVGPSTLPKRRRCAFAGTSGSGGLGAGSTAETTAPVALRALSAAASAGTSIPTRRLDVQRIALD